MKTLLFGKGKIAPQPSRAYAGDTGTHAGAGPKDGVGSPIARWVETPVSDHHCHGFLGLISIPSGIPAPVLNHKDGRCHSCRFFEKNKENPAGWCIESALWQKVHVAHRCGRYIQNYQGD